MNEEKLEKFNFLSNKLKAMTNQAYFYSAKAHDLIITSNKTVQIGALAYINLAAYQISSAKSIYYSNYDILCHEDIDNLFLAFEVFAETTIDNFSTDHSHQWSDIEFENFKSALQNSIFAISNI